MKNQDETQVAINHQDMVDIILKALTELVESKGEFEALFDRQINSLYDLMVRNSEASQCVSDNVNGILGVFGTLLEEIGKLVSKNETAQSSVVSFDIKVNTMLQLQEKLMDIFRKTATCLETLTQGQMKFVNFQNEAEKLLTAQAEASRLQTNIVLSMSLVDEMQDEIKKGKIDTWDLIRFYVEESESNIRNRIDRLEANIPTQRLESYTKGISELIYALQDTFDILRNEYDNLDICGRSLSKNTRTFVKSIQHNSEAYKLLVAGMENIAILLDSMFDEIKKIRIDSEIIGDSVIELNQERSNGKLIEKKLDAIISNQKTLYKRQDVFNRKLDELLHSLAVGRNLKDENEVASM